MNRNLKFLFLLSLLIKLIIAAVVPLSFDEAYYWVWSKNLQLSYFDHPGMTAWLFRIGNIFEQFGHAVRWPAVILGHLTAMVWIIILKKLSVSEDKIFMWFIVCLFSPLLGPGSLVITPDIPVMFFWSCSFYLFLVCIENVSLLLPSLLGLALGLGFCSKYHIVLFIPSAIFYLTIEKKWKYFTPAKIILIVVFGVIGSLPVLYWNFQNDFASIIFQINHGLGRANWDPFWTYSYPIGQILLIFPILFYFACKVRLDSKLRILLYFSWVPLIFFLMSSFRGVVEMNWPIVAYPSFYALSILSIKRFKPIIITIISWTIVYTLIIIQIIYPWYPNAPEKLSEFSYYKPILAMTKKYEPLYAENYQMASYLWYQTKEPIYKLFEMSRPDFYDNLEKSRPNTSIFYVVMDKNAGFPNWLLKKLKQSTVVENIEDTFVIQKVEIK